MTLTVGQKLWYVPEQRYQGGPYEVEVAKVGKKWAEIVKTGEHKYSCGRINKTSLWADGGQHSSPGRCWMSKAEHDAEDEREKVWGSLRNAVHNRWKPPENATTFNIREAARLLKLSD